MTCDMTRVTCDMTRVTCVLALTPSSLSGSRSRAAPTLKAAQAAAIPLHASMEHRA